MILIPCDCDNNLANCSFTKHIRQAVEQKLGIQKKQQEKFWSYVELRLQS